MPQAAENSHQDDRSTGKANLGTFAGVFTPSALTILGIILFLRLGYVVGNAGLGQALLIIGLANIISILTSFSLSAVATNLKVKGGGDYYLISRTLGVAYGGAIGIVLFLAQSVSIAFYCIGFGEALCAILTAYPFLSPRIVAVAAAAFLFVLAWLGADWATRFQYVVMGLLIAALASFYVGGFASWDGGLLVENWAKPGGSMAFWPIFAIFFPAVTGFTQGVSMSGDLKDPGRSLPLGTFLAVGVSIVVYFSVAIIFAASQPLDVLISDYGAMQRVSSVGVLIDAGVVAATLSSAMASFLGAPRIMQSLAGDRIFPFLLPLAKGYGPSDNPRRGVLVSAAIALATIALGNLNLIAPLVTMFFLISYGLLNYATFFEARTASPSFRPRFRWFDYRLSLLGFLACLGVMLAIDAVAGIVAISVLFALFQYLKRVTGPPRWADSRRAYHLQRIRQHLLAAAGIAEHPRNWRPQVLVMTKEPVNRPWLLTFAGWLEGDSGFVTAVHILEGEGLHMMKRQAEAEASLKADLADAGSRAFPLVVWSSSGDESLHTLVQAFGVGPLKANTLLLGWPNPKPGLSFAVKALRYERNLRIAYRHGLNVVLFHTRQTLWNALNELPTENRLIDVWWRNDATSRLMLLLAYLMTRSRHWSQARIRLLAPGKENPPRTTSEDLKNLLEEARIDAEPEVIADMDEDQIVASSHSAAIVFLPFRLRKNRVTLPYGDDPQEVLARLPTTVLVMAAEDIDLDAEPEEGDEGDTAVLMDAYTDALKKDGIKEKEAAAAAEALDEAAAKLKDYQTEDHGAIDHKRLVELESALAEARQNAEKAIRRAAKARAKLENAAREAEAAGIELKEE